MAVISLPLCLWFDEHYALWSFSLLAILSLSLAQPLYRFFSQSGETRLRHAMLIAGLGWALIPLLGSLPFFCIAWQLDYNTAAPRTLLVFLNPWNAFFESVSGFTATGLTMSLRPSELPYSLQWWRSFTEWVGGVGIIVLILAVVKPPVGVQHLYHSEAREEKILPSVASTVRMIWWIYLLYTALSVLALWMAGMPWWDAVNHGMTGIATGGFSIADQGLREYGQTVQLVLIVIMLAGAISFAIHYQLLHTRRWHALWHDTQHQALYSVIVAGTVLLVLENYWAIGSFLWLESCFQWVSAVATAGFQTVDLKTWSPAAQILLSLAMIGGGAAGSTAGGIKQVRIVFLVKGIYWSFRRIVVRPHELIRYELGGLSLTETEADRRVESASVLFLLWVMLLFTGVLTLLHFVPPHFTTTDVVLEVASALGNVGLSTGIAHPDLMWPAKLTLILSMWIGRLEILPAIMLLYSLFREKDWR